MGEPVFLFSLQNGRTGTSDFLNLKNQFTTITINYFLLSKISSPRKSHHHKGN